MQPDNMIQDGFKKTEIGVIPNEWTLCSLKSVNKRKKTSIYPSNFPMENFEYYSIPAYQKFRKPIIEKGANIYSQKLLLKEGTILFGKLNPRVEKVWKVQSYSTFRKIGSTEWITIFPDEDKINSDFLYYIELSKNVMPLAKNMITGSTPSRQRVDSQAFYEIKIPLPPLLEQKKIAAVLKAVQEAKEKTEEVIKAAKELKKSLMKHLFTYGPVSIEEAEKVKLKETELGFFPKYWKLIRLIEQINKPQYGYTASSVRKEVGPKFLRITDIQNDKVYWNNVPFCECSKKDYEKYELKKDDILIARIGATTGKTYIVENDVKAIFASYLIRIKTKIELDSHYLFQFTKTRIYWKQIHSYKGGRLKQGINIPILSNILLPLPPLDIQQKICKILTYIDDKIEHEERKKRALEELFKTLLNNLMTGKIRVHNLDIGA